MTHENLAQVEAAKAALPLAMEPLRGLPQYEARKTITSAALILVERVIELEIQVQGVALLQADKIANLEAEVARLKEWQAKAVPYLKKEKTRIQFVDFDDGEDMPYCLKDIVDITALIDQAQEGG